MIVFGAKRHPRDTSSVSLTPIAGPSSLGFRVTF
jgi:hypothetical protein